MTDELTLSVNKSWTFTRDEVETYLRKDHKCPGYKLDDKTWADMKANSDNYDCWGCEAYLLGSLEYDVHYWEACKEHELAQA